MRLKLTEDPCEWRKAAWFSALGLALLSSVLRWRGVLSSSTWMAVLAVLAVVAMCAWFCPRAFRGWYRFSRRISFGVIEILGRVVLAVFFLVCLTPLALAMRALGKDPLKIKPQKNATTYWIPSKDSTPLDRLF
jgi:hypothetical protein